MTRNTFFAEHPLTLESGRQLENLEIVYHISEPDPDKTKPVVWICHALTANSDPEEWWPGMVGKGKYFDPDKYTIVCANVLGSCYGTTGPASVSPEGKPWLVDFPAITIRDMVACHMLLREHLGIGQIHLLTGGSIGGFQALEWAVMEADTHEHLVLVATAAFASPWAIAINETERMALEADQTLDGQDPEGGKAGLAAARAIGLLSYRGYEAYNNTQSETDNEILDQFRASSYQRYQGEKLVRRFNAYCYHCLTKAQDTHNMARGRHSLARALGMIKARTLVLGIVTDLLFPLVEQQKMHRLIPASHFREIESEYGHDGFLLENEQISKAIKDFIHKQKT